MKIWVIGRSYPEKNNRMSGSFELEQAKLLANKGHDVTYIACVFHPFRKVKKWGFCSWDEENIHIYTYSQFYFPGKLRIYVDSFQKKIWRILLEGVEKQQGTPDIIHVHYPTLLTHPSVILGYRQKGTRIIVTEHWSKVQMGQVNDHELKQLKKYVSEADHFICVGKPLKEKIQELTQTKREIIVLPNVVPDYFICRKKDWDDFRFVAVGRLVPVKQFDKLIRAFWKAYSCEKNVTLTIIGGGCENKQLRKMIDKLGASEQINLTGTLTRNETAERISSSDVLVCYSRYETFSVPVIESWYCGLPVIASDAIGAAEYFDESLGLLIPNNDDNKLIVSLIKIKNDYEKYSRELIHSFAENHFSEKEVYEKLMKVYI
ncbi:MAG: glycosyltransferase family 4 protein [Butyrivibrio sp.]|nr:glycosyltransferase family 4 protein [Butyrivibrio sp.]